MLGIGVTVYVSGVRQFGRALGGKLVTDGLFAWCRHPFYALWLFLLLPGLACIVGNWLALVAPAMAAGTFAAVIGREERELEERFGQDYRDYSRRVGRLWPRRGPS
jgi:protein-S-isoprenylcysteine O-methyltransferase Ste14